MAGQYIPPPELAPSFSRETTFDERLEMWMGMWDMAEDLLIAGFKRNLKEGEDVRDKMREWQRRQNEEKERAVIAACERFTRLNNKRDEAL